ncbi:ribonuclease P protein component [Campylobacter porcelli]|uniref:Ribonuclease P protein component n=1 Tax=Campylobacter porcelli TaxID=1660073 RepID=A0A1X9SV70_9BACT|nr:ribonuclease P protein component [Campylobacter sp. RM6137]ARR00145.1 ribonuclease P, protein component [Campylobacter sp. RM6137]MEE3777093.1 ribonuclease P protein component [Campylobacter sp. CX2-4080-23]
MKISKFDSISDSKEFKKVYQNAKKWHCDLAVVYFLESDMSRFAAVVSKKIGKAVVRNRVKRVFRAAFFALSNELKSGIYIFIAKSGADEVPFDKICKNFRWALKRMDSIR